MGKVALFSLNMIFLVAYNFFFGGEVEVKQVLPDQVTAGEKFDVEITINKGEHEGFAKWQQNLPPGFTATSIESEGATFSFKKNTVKLIWMSLPEQESFVIKYQLESDPNISGDFEIMGKFSFIEDNERRDVESEVHMLSVKSVDMMADASDNGQPDTVAMESPEIETTEAPATAMEVEDVEGVDAEATLALTTLASRGSGMDEMDSEDMNDFVIVQSVTKTRKVKINRKVKLLGPGKYLVVLDIDKDGFKSFGKVEEYIPEGYVASEKESGEGRFSMEEDVLKILWMTMPESSTMQVSYELQSLGDELDSATVHGVFSFLRGDESVQLGMRGTTFPNTFQANVMAEEQTDREVDEVKEVAAVPVPVPVVPKEDLSAEITSVPAPETDVRYKVQIAAARREVGQVYFEQRHSMKDKVTIDYHDSWYKYMIGSYGVYKEARDRRNEVWDEDNKINDAFVTAYNAGERISVQEALMTTKQKWYK